jgi:hypothetical protein
MEEDLNNQRFRKNWQIQMHRYIYLFYSSNGKLQLSSSYIKQTWYKVQIGDCMIPLYILMGMPHRMIRVGWMT